jgi:hypothetical protein
MEITGVGSGVMLAIAAVLWLVYLVPTWLRRREFDATERNAVRLQQTLRVLAETAELPSAIRAENTARSVAAQAKLARAQERARAAQLRAEESRARAEAVAAARTEVARTDAATVAGARSTVAPITRTARPAGDVRVRSAVRVRRGRALSSFLLLVSVAVMVLTIVAAVNVGITMGTWLLVFAALIGVLGSFAMLRRLAPSARIAAAPAAQQLRKRTSAPVAVEQAHEEEATVQREWTPVPVPKPLYMSRQTAPVPASVPAVELDLAAEAARAEAALRAAHAEPEVSPMPERQPAEAAPAAAARPSRFSSMGVLDADALAPTDIDEALRRRRAAS